MSRRVALIDADILVYRAAQTAEVATEFSPTLWGYHARPNVAKSEMDRMVSKIQRGLDADHIVMALSDYEEPNWRYSVYPSYKSTRTEKRRPILWGFLREYILDKAFDGDWETIQWPSLEGDDVLGILLTDPDADVEERICVSLDKDMHTLPGQHLHMGDAIQFDDDDLAPLVYEVTEDEADFFHMTQALAGDATDGYAGCPGIGEVRAQRFLNAGLVLEPHEHTFSRGKRKGETKTRWKPGSEGPLWEVVVSVYESKGFGEEDALPNARVARILRAEDYNRDTGEITLWTPPPSESAV